jgi:photosystem II stability/assembly factor-like uncharacterized protein
MRESRAAPPERAGAALVLARAVRRRTRIRAAGARGSSVSAGAGWTGTRHGVAGRDLNAVYFTDTSAAGWAGDGGLVYRTEDGGRTWVRQTVGTNDQINDLYFRTKRTVISSRGAQSTYRRRRAHMARGRIASPGGFRGGAPELYSVRFASKKKGWIVGSISRREVVTDSLVLYTDDGGATWRSNSSLRATS